MPNIIIDFETRSEIDLASRGLKNYACDDSTDILMLGWKEEGLFNRPLVWFPGDPFPYWFGDPKYHIYAFNAEFELAVWNEVGVKKHNFPVLELKNLSCLAALANRYGLPNAMRDVAIALSCTHKKNDAGKALVDLFCTPKKGWVHDDAKWAEFISYCKSDVMAEENILKNLPARLLSPEERAIWEFTVKMNQRGVPIALNEIKRIRNVTDCYREAMYSILPEITLGKVEKITQVHKILSFCHSRGYSIPNLQASTVAECIEGVIEDADVAQLLEMRASMGASSTGKLARMESMQYEGRVYNNQRYYGALTGRYTGSGVQLLNLPRASVPDPEAEIARFFSGDIIYDDPIKHARALIRPMIKAPEGRIICAADYSSIEYIVLEWLAGNVRAVKDFDKGICAYKDMAAYIFNVPYDEVTKDQRQVGKVAVLGCGYGAGVLAIERFASTNFGLSISPEMADVIVKGYRSRHDKVVNTWYTSANALLESVSHRDKAISFNGCVAKTVEDKMGARWLTLELPSKRKLFYHEPSIQSGKYGPQVCFKGVSPVTKQVSNIELIPGRIVENIVQATSRDIMAHGMLECDRQGLDVIWTCYDEIVVEADEGKGLETLDTLVKCMVSKQEWSKTIPLKAEGFFGKRYKKM